MCRIYQSGSSSRRSVAICAVAVGALTIVGCDDKSDYQFTKVSADRSGITFNNLNIETETHNIFAYEYFYNGGGVAVGDINNDGLPDIYFTSNNHDNKLYLNKGDFKFEDITQTSGTACPSGWKTGVCMVDINGDGWLDIYVSRSGHADPEQRRNILLVNNRDLTFTDKAADYGLDDDSFTTQTAFFDYDRDGDLDAFVLNHSLLMISNSFDISRRNTITRHPYVGNRLLRNDNNVFVDVSDSVGVFGPASNYGLGVSLSDINNDGWIDIYAGCDYTGRDRLLLNIRGQRFVDATDSLLSHISKFTMGTDIADINGDGLMDIYTLDMLPEDNLRQKQLMGSDRFDAFTEMVKNGLHAQYMRNMLHLNNGDGTFSEIGQLAGISNTDWSWAALFGDFDNDGIQDLFVSNGFKRDLTDNDFAKYKAFQEFVEARRKGQPMQVVDVLDRMNPNKIPNYAYRGTGNLTFENVTTAWGFGEPSITNGAAYADLDNDGDLDIVTNNMNDFAGVYRNETDKKNNHFVKVSLIGSGKNQFAIGARVEVYTTGKILVREMLPVRGFQSSNDYSLHFGLGNITAIDSIVVRWPSGNVQAIYNPAVDQLHTIPEAKDRQHGVPARKKPLLNEVHLVDFVHRENVHNDFTVQSLLPRMYSVEGPALATADVNNDDRMDLFVGGAKDQPCALFIQQVDGTFIEIKQPWAAGHYLSEDIDAAFFDMDDDGDLDLYVVTGGYEFWDNEELLRDYLYENDGSGRFTPRSLPAFFSSGSCVRPGDFDRDGDIDLFVGGRLQSGRYPTTPESYLLLNDGHGNFAIDSVFAVDIKRVGMVTDARWSDVNNDGWIDLVIVGEWMPVSIFINESGKLSNKTEEFFGERTHGLWNCVAVGDIDNDGDLDLIAGNHGLNTQMRASQEQPVALHFADYDDNGSIDPLMSYFVQGRSYPYPSRDELTEQLPSFKKRFTNYRSYSAAAIDQVLTDSELEMSQLLKAYCLESAVFENRDGMFVRRELPIQFQMSPLFSLLLVDINGDEVPDILCGGNLSGTRARSGKITGNYGVVALNNGSGTFQVIKNGESGLCIRGDTRRMVTDGNLVHIAVNNGKVLSYRMR